MENLLRIKHFTSCLTFVLLVVICISCVKEEKEEQKEETNLITGTVKDNTDNLLAQAKIKILSNDLEFETESDENGEWTLEIPNNILEGFIVSNKMEYTKSIQRFIYFENKIENVILRRDLTNTENDLSVNLSSLRTVLGRYIDQDSDPVSNVSMALFCNDSIQQESLFHGFHSALDDGTFEIVYEDQGFTSRTLIASVSNNCGEQRRMSLEGIDPVEDLGNIEMVIEPLSIFQATIESDGSDCYENVTTLTYYSHVNRINYNQPLGEFTVEYCPLENWAFYVGVESNDNSYFNGSFFPESEVKETYKFDICTPNTDNFLELYINGNMTLHEDFLTVHSNGRVVSADPAIPFEFIVGGRVKAFEIGTDNVRYDIGSFRKISLNGSIEVDFSHPNIPPYNFVNIVQDDENFFSAVGHVKATANDGSETDIKIRFRIAK